MELGATVCLPNGSPRCGSCPMQTFCRAKIENRVKEIPVKMPPAARKIERKTVLIISCSGKTALRKRPAQGLLANLWEFPHFDGSMTKAQVADLLQEYGFQVRHIRSCIPAKHVFSHLEWHMKSFTAECSNMPPEFIWFSREELLNNIPLPTAFKPFFKVLFPNSK
jgi:A/G-specific adenine glycosylase